MSTADSWDVTVPDEAHAGELLAELRRHGVVAGQRLRVLAVVEGGEARQPGVAASLRGSRRRRRLRFAALGTGPHDISSHADDYLAEGFGEG